MGSLGGEVHVKVETEIRAIQLECLESPETGRSKTGLFPTAPWEQDPADTLISDLRPPDL